MHRVLETLRAAMNWGMAQTPPLFNRSPFHRFGVRLNKKAETARDRRLTRDEEKRLLDAALQQMNRPEHQNVGSLLHDRIIGALELCCRRGEMLMIQNKRVNWDTCQIGIPGATAKDKENRRIPFNPKGRLAAILKRRSELGPDALRVRQRQREPPAEHPDRLGNPEATRERRRTEARKGGSAMESGTARTDRSPLARPAARRRVPLARGRRRHPHHSADARTRQHPANAALLERDRRGNAERTGGELEERRPTASPGVGKLIGLVWFPNCPRFVPGNWKFWLRGRDLNPRPLGYEPNELPDCSTPRQEETILPPQSVSINRLDEKLTAGERRRAFLSAPSRPPRPSTVDCDPAVILMRSLRAAAAAAICGLIVIGSTAPGAEQQPAPAEPLRSPSPLRISVELVQLDAIVTDENGATSPTSRPPTSKCSRTIARRRSPRSSTSPPVPLLACTPERARSRWGPPSHRRGATRCDARWRSSSTI